MKKNLKTIVVIIVSLVVLACTIFLVWSFLNEKTKKLNSKTDNTTNKEEKKNENKNEKLDVNSDLVKKLESKLAFENRVGQDATREFNLDTTKNKKEELRIITASLDLKKAVKNTCSEFNAKYKVGQLPGKKSTYKLVHDCDEIIKDLGIKETVSFTKEYVEEVAKNLFGSDYKLNTLLPLSFCACFPSCDGDTSELGWYYDDNAKLYIRYEHISVPAGIGCATPIYDLKVDSAEKINGEIILNATLTLNEDNTVGDPNTFTKKTFKFEYKFKQDKNKDYYLYSKTYKE
jgi:lipoprotein